MPGRRQRHDRQHVPPDLADGLADLERKDLAWLRWDRLAVDLPHELTGQAPCVRGSEVEDDHGRDIAEDLAHHRLRDLPSLLVGENEAQAVLARPGKNLLVGTRRRTAKGLELV